MGKYYVLRNCYTVEQRYFAKGDVVDLPDEMFKYEKNFAPVGEVVDPTPKEPTTLKELQEKKPETALAVTQSVTTPAETPPEPRLGEYLCTKCSTIHRESSGIGKRHLKHRRV